MRKILLSAAALIALSAQSAFAMNLTFQFDVNSSGPSLYACNAGIKHSGTNNLCFDRRDASKSCTPGCAAGNLDACTNNIKPVDCVCTGEYDPTGNEGTYRMDFLQAATADWSDNGYAATTGLANHTLTADGTKTNNVIQFSQLFGSNGQFPVNAAYEKQITSMSVNLGSEVYGAEYFVDICYRGPQIDYRNNNTTVSGLNFNMKAFATLIDLKKVDGKSYHELAGLKVKAEARCIFEDEFNYCLGDLLPGQTAGCGGTASTEYSPVDAGTGLTGFNPIISGNTNVIKLINNASISGNGNKTPRFCQVRYSFKEENKTEIRKWKLQRGRVCTYTEITEPTVN